MKILEGRDNGRCPRCRREGMEGRKHKERPHGVWCIGKLSEEERATRLAKEKAASEFRRLRDAWYELHRAGRYGEALALCLNGTSALQYRLREVAREKADDAGLD